MNGVAGHGFPSGVAANARIALLVAMVSHAAMPVWSLLDFVAKAVVCEKADPATVDQTRRDPMDASQPVAPAIDAITCAAMLVVLAGYH